MGLLKERTGVAAGVLSENGVEEDRLLEMIKELIVPESVVTVKEREGYSPRCEAVLEEAHRQAQRFYADQTGTEQDAISYEAKSGTYRCTYEQCAQDSYFPLTIFINKGIIQTIRPHIAAEDAQIGRASCRERV